MRKFNLHVLTIGEDEKTAINAFFYDKDGKMEINYGFIIVGCLITCKKKYSFTDKYKHVTKIMRIDLTHDECIKMLVDILMNKEQIRKDSSYLISEIIEYRF